MKYTITIKYTSFLLLLLLLSSSISAQYFKAKKIDHNIISLLKHDVDDNMFRTHPPYNSVFGQVFRGTERVDYGMVYLYSYDSSSSTYLLYDSVMIQQIVSLNISYYYFDSVPTGLYTTKAVLLESSLYYNQYAPAYYGNTFYWTQAQQIGLNQSGLNYPINLCNVIASMGQASISGQVLQGTSKSPGDPVAGVPLYLINEDNHVLGFAFSNSNGNYSFSNLPFGKYYVYSDLMNYMIYPSITSMHEGDKHKTNINVYIGQNMVTGINASVFDKTNIEVYPNPTSDIINLKLDLDKESLLTAKIYTVTGAIVSEIFENKYFSAGKQNYRIQAIDLPNGIYMLNIENNEHQRKLIKLIVIK